MRTRLSEELALSFLFGTIGELMLLFLAAETLEDSFLRFLITSFRCTLLFDFFVEKPAFHELHRQLLLLYWNRASLFP